jgi:hypothetical protein
MKTEERVDGCYGRGRIAKTSCPLATPPRVPGLSRGEGEARAEPWTERCRRPARGVERSQGQRSSWLRSRASATVCSVGREATLRSDLVTGPSMAGEPVRYQLSLGVFRRRAAVGPP